MIHVSDLTKWYGRVLAVDHISFDIEAGQVVGFLGPNGAGKSTTLKMLTCYLPATSGSASIAGYDVLSNSLEVRRNIGYMPESVPVYPEMRVEEYLLFRAALRDIPSRRRRAAVQRVAERCWLKEPENMMRRRVGELSRGYRQRVGLAEVLLHDPPVLVLDEPTLGLDPVQIRSMRNLVRDLGDDHTVILSSHILAEVEQICNEIIIIAGGTIAAQGKPEELRDKVVTPSRLIAEIKGAEPEEIVRAMKGLTGVQEIEHEPAGSWTQLRIQGPPRQDLRSEVYRTVAEKRWQMRELRREIGSLEDYFVEITYKQNVRAAQPASA